MRLLAGSLADGVLADAILIPPRPPMVTRDELSTTCNPKVTSRCLSAPDATSLYHCLKNKQLKLIWLQR